MLILAKFFFKGTIESEPLIIASFTAICVSLSNASRFLADLSTHFLNCISVPDNFRIDHSRACFYFFC